MHSNSSYSKLYERHVDNTYAYIERRNAQAGVLSFRESITAPKTTEYVVLPDGTIEFLCASTPSQR